MLFNRSLAALCAALLLATQTAAYAQNPDAMQQAPTSPETNQETIDLLVGDIFEILPAHTLGPNASYTWILTQDRNFIEAGRAQTFRKRLIQPGRYTLYAEISNDTTHVSRTFTLDYKSRLPGQVGASGASGSGASSLVQTIPSLTANSRTILKNGSQLVKLMPVNPDIRPLVLDLNIAEDTDGDGNPANDIQSDLTFFQTDATPLFVWFASPLTSQTMTITAAQPAGAVVQTIQVATDAFAQDQGFAESPVGVTIEKLSDRTYSFMARTDASIPEQTPLLYVWEFGDGQQSLLASPTHEYAGDGDYTVKLRVRNLTNGQDVANYTEELSVAGSDAVSSEPTEPDNEDPVTEPSNEGGMLGSIGSILMLVGVFIGSIVLGVLVMIGISKMRRKGGTRLSDTLEKMEQSIVKTDTATPPPLTITPVAKPAQPQTPPPAVAEREKENAAARPTTVPTKVEEKNAPSWLKSGLSAPAAQAPVTPPTPAPTPAPATPVAQAPKPATPPAPTPTSAPQTPKPQTPPPTPKQSAVNTLQSAPAWLQQKPAATPAAPAPTSTPTPAPVQPKPQTPPPAPQPQTPPTPPAQPKPAAPVAEAPKPQTPPPAPAPVQPKPTQNTTPAWLQQAEQKAPQAEQPKPATPPAPKPQTPAPAPATAPSAPTPTAATPTDEPIAFIRADSLNQNPQPDSTQTPPPAAA